MRDVTDTPVVFLAFANDRGGERDGYLRELPHEARELRRVLEAAERAGWCDLVVRSNASLEDVFDVFQDRRFAHRIAVFHYGGHANSYQLLLETDAGATRPAFAEGLVALLAHQRGLRLVFLNGCSTERHAHDLARAGVPAVIGTSRAIGDRVAREFAARFYAGLAHGHGLADAYRAASAELRAHQGEPRRAYREVDLPEASGDAWPWTLAPDDEGNEDLAWSLPAAAEDPTGTLPPVPAGDLPAEPFINLHWFTRRDAEVFFGRGRQIRGLYDQVTAEEGAPTILLYGQSGVGKSSLLEAGLMPRLETSHRVHYTRRDQRAGLTDTLRQALAAEEGASLPAAWRASEARHDRPLVVIVDQLEEALTRPDPQRPDELARFVAAVDTVFGLREARPRGRLVLGFRKEWLAEVERHLAERSIPHGKLFVEPLDRRGIIEAITGPARSKRLRQRYGLSVERGLPEIIADDLLADSDAPIAPTLQILLTKMWTEAKTESASRPRFTTASYHALKSEGILLGDFLDRQLEAVRAWRPEVVDSGLALDVLAFHTTPTGTSEQRTADALRDAYRSQDRLPDLIQTTKDLYLLTDSSGDGRTGLTDTRLAHDTLGPLVRQRFDESDKPGQRARRILESRAVDWLADQPGTPLDEHDTTEVEKGASGMRAWRPEESRLMEASRRQRARDRWGRRARRVVGAMAVVAIVVFALIAVQGRQDAVRQAQRADHQAREARLALSNQLAAQAGAALDASLPLSLLLALEALEITSRVGDPRAPAAEEILRRALAEIGGRVLGDHGGSITRILSSADGSWLVTATGTPYSPGGARVWRLIDGAVEHVRVLGAETVSLSPNGRWLATTTSDALGEVWDLASGDDAPARLSGEIDRRHAFVFDLETDRLATLGGDGSLLLWSLAELDAEPTVLRAGRPAVQSFVFGPSGGWLATMSDDGAVHLWDLDDARVAPTALPDDVGFEAVASSQDGRRLAAGSRDGRVRLWDIAAVTTEADAWQGHEAGVEELLFSPDGHWLLTLGQDRVACLWELSIVYEEPCQDPVPLQLAVRPSAPEFEGEVAWIARFRATSARVDERATRPVAFRAATGAGDLPDAANVTAGGDPTPGSPGSAFQHAVLAGGYVGAGVEAVAFSADSRWLVTAGGQGVHLWDLDARSVLELPSYGASPEAMAFSPTGRWLATGSSDGAARLWDLTPPDPTTAPRVLRGHERSLETLAFLGDDRWLVTGSADRTARLWDLDDLHVEPSVVAGLDEERVSSLVIGPRGRWGVAVAELVTRGGASRNTAHLHDLRDLHAPPRALDDHGGTIASATLSPDGRWLVTSGDGDGVARLYDLSTSSADPDLLEHPAGVSAQAFSADAAWLVTGSRDGSLRRWDVGRSDADPAVLRGHGGAIVNLSLGEGGQRAATIDEDGTLRVWNLSAPEGEPRTLRHPGGEFMAAALSPDGRWFASSLRDGDGGDATYLWDLALQRAEATHALVDTGADLLVFSPGGSRLLSIGAQGTELWDLTGSEPASLTLFGLTGPARSVAFSAEEHRLAISEDATVHLWDLATLELTAQSVTLHGHGHPVLLLMFDPFRLISADASAAIRTWRLDVSELVDISCNMAGRGLSRSEWERFRGQDIPFEPACRGGDQP